MPGTIARTLRIGDRTFEWGSRTYVMGVINVSPESFSGDGLSRVDDALRRAERLAEEGADILDAGGQSTRPGFDEITVAQEIERVVPVIARIVKQVGVPVSVDTYRAEVAQAALDAGASLVNDIWGFRHDPSIAVLCVRRGVPAVVMHNQRGRDFEDVIGDIRRGLRESIRTAERSGLARDQLILDPGLGSVGRRSRTWKCCDGWASCATWTCRCWWARRANRPSGPSSATHRSMGACSGRRRR